VQWAETAFRHQFVLCYHGEFLLCTLNYIKLLKPGVRHVYQATVTPVHTIDRMDRYIQHSMQLVVDYLWSPGEDIAVLDLGHQHKGIYKCHRNSVIMAPEMENPANAKYQFN